MEFASSILVMRNRPIPHLDSADKAYVRGFLIYEDASILAFNKPSGLPSQTRGNRGRNLDHLLWAFARSNGKRPRLLHRLDTGTSGLVLAAKTHPAAVHMSAQFEARTVQKAYFAIVDLQTDLPQRGRIQVPIARLDQKPPKVQAGKNGKTAKTAWRLISRHRSKALLEVRPETGRMHQIRAHLSSIGAPLVGDPLYGGAQGERLMLHAYQITLQGLDNESQTYTAFPGDDLRYAWESFGLSYEAP